MRSWRGHLLVVALAVALVASACGQSSKETPVADDGLSELGPVSGTVTVYGRPEFFVTMGLLRTEFEKENPDAKVNLTLKPREQLVALAQKDLPDVIVEQEGHLDPLKDAGPGLGEIQAFGTDTFVIATPKDNPAGVSNLSAFGGSSTAKTVPCSYPTIYGDLAKLVLAAASVTPAEGAVKACDPNDIVRRLSNKELDAALIMRSDVAPQADKIAEVPVPDAGNVRVNLVYAARRGSAGGARFAQLVQSGPGQQILQQTGLLP